MTSMEQPVILIVDDEIDFAKGLARLIGAGRPTVRALTAHNGNQALELLEQETCLAMLLDLKMPGQSGLELLPLIREQHPETLVIVLTAHATVETAVLAIKQGAWDFLTKPVRGEDLLHTLDMALEHGRLRDENQRLRLLMAQSGLERALIGDSTAMQRLKESIAAVAASSYNVLILGESGTGKELAAEGIHRLSQRAERPFVKVNCPAIPEQLLESELFGHVKGAFTGAIARHNGLFVQASGGTLLLDEIGDISLSIQKKLLRTLQDGEIRPVGSNRATQVDVRIIAATNQDLEQKIRQGLFREDLFYRLNVLCIQTPPLRERREDIPLLAAHFLLQACTETQAPCKRFAPEATALLIQHDWPGNVRELQNFVRRAAVFSSADTIQAAELQFSGLGQSPLPNQADNRESPVKAYKQAKQQLLDSFTRDYLRDLLGRTGGNISEAARLSGLERVSLQKILRRLEISAAEFRQ